MRRVPSLAIGALLWAGTLLAALGGCGSRGPLDLTGPTATADASAADGATAIDAGPEAGSPRRDSGFEAGTVAACGVCVAETCTPAVVTCIQSPACVGILQCAATRCLGLGGVGGVGGRDSGAPRPGGGLNLGCVLACAGSDPQGILDLLGVVRCVTADCGPDCGSLLGGLGGLAGLGGGGGGRGGVPAGAPPATPEDEARAFQEAFAPWPEIFAQ